MISLSTFAQDTIPNGSFERWEMVNTWFEEPVSWVTNNTQVATLVERDTTAHSGDFSIRIRPGGAAWSTFPLAHLPLYASAFVKTGIPSSGAVMIRIALYNNDTVGAQREWTDTVSSDTFEQIMIPFSGVPAFSPDSAKVELVSGKSNSGESWALWVDRMYFSYPLGTPSAYDQDNWNIYPNPAKSHVQVSFDDLANLPEQLIILDLKGRAVRELEMVKEQMTIDVSHLPSGTYYLVGFKGNERIASKLVIAR